MSWANRSAAVALAGGGAMLGWWLPRLERTYPSLGGFTYDSATALATLSAISTGVITLFGLVLAATTIVVQSVQAASPRLTGVLGYFERSLMLFGALAGTALYALIVLTQIRPDFAPNLSVTLAVVFVLLSSAAILRSLAGLREMITGGGLVRAVAQQLHAVLDSEWTTHGTHGPATASLFQPDESIELAVQRRGVVRRIDSAALAAAAERIDAHVVCLISTGTFVEPGTPALQIITAAPAGQVDTARLLSALHIGPSRRLDHDPAYGLRLLVDIALRALSPAVNDPTTAIQAIDRIESALLRLARCPLGPTTHHDRTGVPRATINHPRWTDLLELALAEITIRGATSLQVHRRLRFLLATLTKHLPPDRLESLTLYQDALAHTARTFPTPALTALAGQPDPQGLGAPAMPFRLPEPGPDGSGSAPDTPHG
ncbi:DUF2254 family protein [Streptomyces parvus]|uniref:DUF2254 family protein n=1 Tax=Streptomyces parvus TaxID=66428 RepID=UPI0036B581EE